MIRTVVVKFRELELTVSGYHSPYMSGSWEQPPEQESFEINTIHWNDVDVTPIFNELISDWRILEEVCLEYINNY